MVEALSIIDQEDFAAGADEPNAKLQVNLNGHSEPNVNVTEIELVEGITLQVKTVGPLLNLILEQ